MGPYSAVTPLARPRRSLQIAEDLKHMINSGELAAGRRIPTEMEICQRYGVSRTTVREALQTLRSTGVLEVTPGRGSYVRRPDPALMLGELSIVLTASGACTTQATLLVQHLARYLVPEMGKSTLQARQVLFQHVINRSATPAENAALEVQWYAAFAGLCAQPLAGHVIQLLLGMTMRQREKAFANQGYTDTLEQAQIRLTRALCDDDLAAAERLLGGLFIAPAT